MRHCLTLCICEAYLISFVHSSYTLTVLILAISPQFIFPVGLVLSGTLYIFLNERCTFPFNIFSLKKKISLPDVHLLTVSLILHGCILSHVWLFVIPWTIAHEAPLSIAFSRQEYWNRLHFLLLWSFPTQGLNTHPLCLMHWHTDSLPLILHNTLANT